MKLTTVAFTVTRCATAPRWPYVLLNMNCLNIYISINEICYSSNLDPPIAFHNINIEPLETNSEY